MKYTFLNKFKIAYKEVEESEAKRIGRLKHCFFSLPELYIQKAILDLDPFPIELRELYEEVGFGFLHRGKNTGSCLIDAMSLIYINTREGYLVADKVQEYLDCYDTMQKLLFFHTFEEQYFAISRIEENGQNAVWYKDEMIEKSLYDFLHHYSTNSEYLSFYISKYEKRIQKERARKEKEEKKILEEKRRKIRYLGGHELLDHH